MRALVWTTNIPPQTLPDTTGLLQIYLPIFIVEEYRDAVMQRRVM